MKIEIEIDTKDFTDGMNKHMGVWHNSNIRRYMVNTLMLAVHLFCCFIAYAFVTYYDIVPLLTVPAVACIAAAPFFKMIVALLR